MRFSETDVVGVVHVEIEPIRDDRGFFARAWCADEFAAAGIGVVWMQANLARNAIRGTLRGMHFQRGSHAEAKLVRCTRGRLYDVAVDLRAGQAFGQWVGVELSADRGNMLYIPPGCAHGYLTLEGQTDLFYTTSHAYDPKSAYGVRYNDPRFGIAWPAPIMLISEQDRSWPDVSGPEVTIGG